MADAQDTACFGTTSTQKSRPSQVELSVPTASEHYLGYQQHENLRNPSERANLNLIHDKASKEDFARTRSPPPVDLTDLPSNYRSPSVEDCEDVSDSPPSRISPFAHAFWSVDEQSPFFSRRKATPPQELTAIPSDATTTKSSLQSLFTTSEHHAPSSEDVVAIRTPDPIVVEQAAACQESEVEAAQDKTTEGEAQKNSDSPKGSTSLEPTDIPEAITTPGVLSVLEEHVDQQLEDDGRSSTSSISAEKCSRRSSPTLFLPRFEGSKSLQTSWGVDLRNALEEPMKNSYTQNAQPKSYMPQLDATWPSSDEDHSEDTSNDSLYEEFFSKPLNEVQHLITFELGQHDPTDTSAEMHSTTKPDIPQQRCGDHSRCYSASKTPDAAHESMNELSGLSNSPDSSECIVFRPSCPQNTPTPSKPQALIEETLSVASQDGDVCAATYKTGVETSKMSPASSSSSSAEHHDQSQDSNSLLAVLLGSPNVGGITRESHDYDEPSIYEKTSAPNILDARPTQSHPLSNEELEKFKSEFLQQLNSILKESTDKWIPARNSIAATLLTRPPIHESLNLLRSEIKNDICEMEANNRERIDAFQAELFNYNGNTTKAMKELSTTVEESLKCAVIWHINQRVDEFEKSQLKSITSVLENLVQERARVESSVEDIGHTHELPTLENLSEAIEQMKSLVVTSTKEISNKPDLYECRLKTEQLERAAVATSMQNEIIANLREIITQSSLQNNAINNLITTVDPLKDLTKSISHDTAFIDAKLEKNVAVLTTVTEQTEALQKTANSFSKVIDGAGVASRLANTETMNNLLTKVARIAAKANLTTNTATKVDALQGQVAGMQAQLDRIVEILATREATETAIPNPRAAHSRSASTECANCASEPMLLQCRARLKLGPFHLTLPHSRWRPPSSYPMVKIWSFVIPPTYRYPIWRRFLISCPKLVQS